MWRREGERPSTNKKTARRRSHQVNVRREGVHILAFAAEPAPAAAMPRIKPRPGRIGKSSYGLHLEFIGCGW